MNRHERDRYYQDYGNENRQDFNRYDRQGRDLTPQFEREYQRQYQDEDRSDFGRNRYSSDRDKFQSYRSRDYDMERNYNDNTRGRKDDLGNIRQGYGIPGFGGTSERNDTVGDMQRERKAQQQQGYGSGRMSGYSGSRFGGSNYSTHGEFGGSDRYGSMSGGGGNSDDYVSSSGYGGGQGESYTHSERGVPNYSMRNFNSDYGAGTSGSSTHGGKNYGGGNNGGSMRNNTYGSSSGNYGSGGTSSSDRSNFGRYASDADRGGYTNFDPNR
jgi:hypothetical protein